MSDSSCITPMTSVMEKAAEALRLRNEGKTNEEIGAALGISAKTAKQYVSKERKRLGIARPIRWVRGTLAERMAVQTDRSGPMCERLGTQCWTWIGVFKRAYGYILDTHGEVGDPMSRLIAHRAAYMLATGKRISRGTMEDIVRHKCDNPKCVNPEHLELGTQLDNIHDAIDRGRFKPGRRKRRVA